MSARDALWAKKFDDGRFYYLPLPVHLKDTAYVAGMLYYHWLSDGVRRSICAGVLDEDEGADLCRFLGAVHDLGKATPIFQTTPSFSGSKDLDDRLLENLEAAGFSGIAQINLIRTSKTHHSLCGEKLLVDFGLDPGVASIVGAHHGKPADSKADILDQAAYLAHYRQVSDSADLLYRRWHETQKTLFDWALELCGYASAEEVPSLPQPSLVLLSGVVIMADWIASNPRYFPLFPLDEQMTFDEQARHRAGWLAWRKTDFESFDGAGEVDARFQSRFSFPPRPEQSAFFHTVDEARDPGLFIFEAPMGLGKTEAALFAAELLMEKTGRSGLFFGLPTQATSNGMFGRVKDWIEAASVESASIQLAHGKASLNAAYAALDDGARGISQDSRGTVVANAWFRGKKTTALDDFVVGTVDQFLLAALKQKHLALRHLGFSKKVVVLDEVHAYDAYMSVYLLEAIEWMAAYGVPMIILSATLPAERRMAMIEAYLKGRGLKKKEIAREAKDFSLDAYPLITYTDGDLPLQFSAFSPGKEKMVRVAPLSEGALYDEVESLLKDGGVLGIVVNTVKRAQTIGRHLAERYGKDRVSVLHSAFVATDRANKERELMDAIGKGGTRPDFKIVVGTQVIEQSLDIDFDVMISDLAPVDLLIQRVGRLHRHEKTRQPDALKRPVLYILGAEVPFEKGSAAIYGEYLLARTLDALPDVLRLPTDISPLVQEVYGPLATEDEAAQKYIQLLAHKQEKAKVYRLSPPKTDLKPRHCTLTGWLANDLVGETEEGAAARVRDIDESIEVIVVTEREGGYGFFNDDRIFPFDEIDGPHAMDVANHTLTLPKAVYGYDGKSMDQTIDFLEAHTLKHFPQWQKSPWLKGSLGVLFNQDQTFSLNGFLLTYDDAFGLMAERM